jgi:hypothetical protein
LPPRRIISALRAHLFIDDLLTYFNIRAVKSNSLTPINFKPLLLNGKHLCKWCVASDTPSDSLLTVHKAIIVYVDISLDMGEKSFPAVGVLTTRSELTQLDNSIDHVILKKSWVKNYEETRLRNE